MSIKPIILKSSTLQLEPFNDAIKQELFTAAQDEAIWKYHSIKALGDKFYPWFDKALEHFQNHKQLPFVVRRLADKKIIGSTRYYDICLEHKRVTIGYTWYIQEVWGSYVNPTCKYLLLQHAFENLQLNRVEFCIDSRNTHSIAAVKKLGAKEEGILRQHIVFEDGYIRDSVILSIIKSEWPEVKLRLKERI